MYSTKSRSKCNQFKCLLILSYRLDAYAAGVNDFIKNMKVYPLEFYILWTDFEPWTPIDSIGV